MKSLKNKSLKKSLTEQAKENATVTKGTSKNQTTLKEGVPNDHSRKHLESNTPVVGVNIGVTLNMQDYNSLRVDVWLTDKVQDNETIEQAYDRVASITDKKLNEIVEMYKEQ